MGTRDERKAHKMSYHLGLPGETSMNFLFEWSADILKYGEVKLHYFWTATVVRGKRFKVHCSNC